MDIVKFVEPWAYSRQQEEHLEALMTYGEKVMVRQVWKLEDLTDGLVTRCQSCHAGADITEQERILAVYKQAGESYCSSCYGVGFTGGFQNTVYIMYAMVRDGVHRSDHAKTGEMEPSTPSAQFPWTPEFHPGDLVMRVKTWIDDDTPNEEWDRFVLGPITYETVRTGPHRRTTQGAMTAREPVIFIGQTAEIRLLPQEHPYRGVPFS